MGQLVLLENANSLATAMLPAGLALAGFGLLGVFTGQVIASLIAVGIGFVLYRRLVADDPLFPTVGELAAGHRPSESPALAVDPVRPLDRVRQEPRFAVQPRTDSPARQLRTRGRGGTASRGPELHGDPGRAADADLAAVDGRSAAPAGHRARAGPAGRSCGSRCSSGAASAVLALAFAAVAWLVIPLLYGAEYRRRAAVDAGAAARRGDARARDRGRADLPDLRPHRPADPDQHRDPGARAAGDVLPGRGGGIARGGAGVRRR